MYNVMCIAVPTAMKLLGKVAKILVPSMMPNEVGTVTPDVASAVENVKEPGEVHC